MELPDCPPGAEGYEDSVVEMPKKPNSEDVIGTKAEQEFFEHLNSLKIKVENEEPRPMVERRGRDVSGKWIYLCYPCAAVCSGETILQTHISGKKHKIKLSMRNVWPKSIFEEHPFILSEKGANKEKTSGATEKVLQKMAEEVNYHNNPSELESKYNKYRNVRTHIQDSLDLVKAPLLGIEYLVEHPPEEVHHEPSYVCTLCSKQGHPRTIINHLTCFWHRYNYLVRHYTKASDMLGAYKSLSNYREGTTIIINRIAQRIEDKYGRLKPVNIDKEEYEKEKDHIHQWLFKSFHFSEKDGPSFEEVVDIGLLESLHQSNAISRNRNSVKNPSPPVVAAPTKPIFNAYTKPAGRQQRRAVSPDVLSDVSDEGNSCRNDNRPYRKFQHNKGRYEPYRDNRRESPTQLRDSVKKSSKDVSQEKQKPPNYEYKVKLAEEQRKKVEDVAIKALNYHEKNPEKHPLYPEEWKKFWNRRYKEIQSEGKDPSKHDFKPEWILFWTARMKELHDEELRVNVNEIYRKMCLSPPGMAQPEKEQKSTEPVRRSPDSRYKSPEPRRRSPIPRRRSPEPRRRSPDPRRRSPAVRRRSPEPRRRSPDLRRRTPEVRRRSPEPRRRSPDLRRRSPDVRKPPYVKPHNDRYHRDFRSPGRPYDHPGSPSRPMHKTRSRSPITRNDRGGRGRRSRSPLSRREAMVEMRNRSRSPLHLAPSMQTVLISDEELKPDEAVSPWNSDNDIESLGSLPEVKSPTRNSRAGSELSKSSRPRQYSRPEPCDLGPPENVVATLRLLVALEDYLGSIGPKVVDLLTEALKMEKDKANSSEDLLVCESAVVMLETAKEKLKGAVQAGLVPSAAAGAVRTAIVRVAATLHEADKRSRAQKESASKSAPAPVPVAGVGEVDRAQIAQQMAAALIAQGKTDVSSEELAQLVDAVVGMAEAKKREAEKMDKPVVTTKPPTGKSSSASALQLLQSAYDENDKKVEKEGTPDAMDGLSDSDLETLLKNFNELSAEEQHSLIAYLKKLEAREPQRVEKLRQYVGAAETKEELKPTLEETKPVTIESDDDDYTVEEVFQSATQKVKEDQIRQEMEIVKKSLEESKAVTPATETKSPAVNTPVNLSSASELLALVQASIQSGNTASVADVVTSNIQPRSFGDVHEPPITQPEPSKPLLSTPQLLDQLGENLSGGLLRSPQQPLNFGGNRNNPIETYNNQGNWNQNAQDNRGALLQDNRGSLMHDNRGLYGQGNRDQYIQDNNRGQLMQDNRGSPMLDNRGPPVQDTRGLHMQDNRGQPMLENRGILNSDNRGPPIQEIRATMQDNRGTMQDNRGPMQDDRGPMQDNRGPMQDNRGLMPNNRGPLLQDNRGLQMQDNRVPLIQDNRLPLMQDNRGGAYTQDNRGPYMQGDRSHYMQDNRGMQNSRFPMQNNDDTTMQINSAPMQNNMQANRGPLLQGAGQFMQDNRGPPPRGPTSFGNNQGPRNNFMNGRMQDNFQQQDQQYGNQQKNFRGRGGGRGQYGGPTRGRGRGGYY